MKHTRWLLLLGFLIPVLSLNLHAHANRDTATAIRVGAVFPLSGMTSILAHQELRGVTIAQQMVNQEGGVLGRPISLEVKDLTQTSGVQPIMSSLRNAKIGVVLGAYSSELSIPVSAAAAGEKMLYWEAGAEADRLTGRGLPLVFRVGASGSNLGTNSALFAYGQLAGRLHMKPSHLRIVIVAATDDYAASVGDAAQREAKGLGMPVVARFNYNPYLLQWKPTLAAIRSARPDILILASHIPDGVSFRRAMLADHLHVKAFIGSTMAECGPDFGAELGRDAIGVFASDRPEGGFNERALLPGGLQLYRRFQALWKRQTGQKSPTEEGLAGFSAAWVLFHDVLPAAGRRGPLTPQRAVIAARSLDLPYGSLPNGAGLRFAADKAHLGQNVRAAAVVWQWQAVRHSVVVWPPVYATGKIKMVPLPR